MKKKYIVNLSAQERQDLTDLVRKGKAAAYRRTHAQIMLFAEDGRSRNLCQRSVDTAPGHQRGMALFVTLVMVVIILLIMGTISYRQQLDFKRSSQMLLSDQVVLLALSGESWAKKILLEDARDNQADSLEDDWAQSLPVLPVEGGFLTGCLLDLNARFNLNNLGAYTPEKLELDLNNPAGSQVGTFLSLLALLGLDSSDERASVLIDWIDANGELVAVGGAEDAEYSLDDPPGLAANSPLGDLGELAAVYGYSAAELSILRPYVAALGYGANDRGTEINVNTANRNLLLSLAAGLDEYIVDAIIENRPFESKDEFYTSVADETGYLTVAELKQQLPVDLIGVVSHYFELNTQVNIAGIDMALRSTLHRSGASRVRTLNRTFEYLPRLELAEGQADPLLSPCLLNEDDSDRDGPVANSSFDGNGSMRPLHKVASEARSRQKKAQKRSAFYRPCFWYGCQ